MKFPNIKLQKELPFKKIDGLINDTELKRIVTEQKADIYGLKKLYELYKKMTDNAYFISYQLMDENSDDGNVLIMFGLSQLLRQNYWSSIYHIEEGLSDKPISGKNDILILAEYLTHIRAIDSIKDFSLESPLIYDDIDPEDFFLVYEKLENYDVENLPKNKAKLLDIVEHYYKLSIYINNIIRVILKNYNNKTFEQGILLAKSYLNLLKPKQTIKICKRLIAQTEGSDNNKYGAKCYLMLAYSYNLIDDNDGAAKSIVDLPKSYLVNNPSLSSIAYNIIKHSGNQDLGNKFISETFQAIKNENIFKNRYFGEVNCATKLFHIRQNFGKIRKIPPILISTISKSGSTFLPSQLIMKVGIPPTKIFYECTNDNKYWYDFPINPESLEVFSKGGAICRQHFAPTDSTLKILSSYGIKKILFHIRDPRQSLISWLYYEQALLRRYSNLSVGVREITAAKFGKLDTEQKIDFYIDTFYKQTINLIDDWFMVKENSPYGIEVKITRFEDMIIDQEIFFKEIFEFYGINNYYLYENLFYKINNMLKPDRITKKRKGEKYKWNELLNNKQIKKVNNLIPKYLRRIYPA